jgi:hypothetical protein
MPNTPSAKIKLSPFKNLARALVNNNMLALTKKDLNRVLQMASFSRSGETLFLRCLHAHPDVHVVHQILEPDRKCDFALFRFLKTFAKTAIPHNHPLVTAAGVPKHATILVKNAVWTHAYPFDGFVLVRNPFSVIQSFKLLNETADKSSKRKKQLMRWAKDIDPLLLPAMDAADNVECVCILYNRKMAPLADLGLPIVSYEQFVLHPKQTLAKVVDALGLRPSEAPLKSHERYQHGHVGHGKIPLWKPIHSDSLNSWQKLPRGLLSRIYGLTWNTMNAFGYKFDGNKLKYDSVGL